MAFSGRSNVPCRHAAELADRQNNMRIVHEQVSIFRFLFRLAARAKEMSSEEFLNRLVVGIANRYGATSCSIYRYGRMRTTAWAPVGRELQDLSREDRAYLHNLDGRLVQEAMSKQDLVSGLDLDVDGDLHDFLDEHLPDMDIFAFPLMVREGPRGAMVIYLSKDATALTDADIQAFMGMGEVLQVAEEDLLPAKRRTSRRKRRKHA